MPTRTVQVTQLVMDIEDEQRRRDWTNNRVARFLSVSPSTLTNWYSGREPTINADNLRNICEFLGIEPREVFHRLDWLDDDGTPVGSRGSRPYLAVATIMALTAA